MTDPLSAFVTLFVVIDPIGLLPIFAALTAGMDRAARRAIALRACGVAAGLLALFGLAGEALLGFVGITMPAFRIAGGILLFLTALDMLFERRKERREDKAEQQRADPSVFPLAIPLVAGPGAIATMILLVGQSSEPVHIASIYGVMLTVIALTLLSFLLAAPFERLLGRIGIDVVTRLLGMLLAALSVQFVIDGLRGMGALP